MKASHISLWVPSKTFLMGEYAVLHGGPALVLTHGPRFCLQIDQAEEPACEGIHPMSPAGQWLRAHAIDFAKSAVQFLDPHLGMGGFGASSAQFVTCFAWSELPEKNWQNFSLSVEKLWSQFRNLNHGAGQVPSGADVVAQALGQVTLFSATPFHAQALPWSFADLGVLLIPTGEKLATHEHLRERLPVSEHLLTLARAGASAFLEKKSESFLTAFRRYGEELERLQLVTSHTRGLLAQLASHPAVLAVKGCGAMGADVVAILAKTTDLSVLGDWVRRQGFQIVGTSENLEMGLTLEARLAPRHRPREDETWV